MRIVASYLDEAGFVIHIGPFGQACHYQRGAPEKWCLKDKNGNCVVWMKYEADAIQFVATGVVPERE